MINRTTLFYRSKIDCKKVVDNGQNTLIYFVRNLFYKLISQKMGDLLVINEKVKD